MVRVAPQNLQYGEDGQIGELPLNGSRRTLDEATDVFGANEELLLIWCGWRPERPAEKKIPDTEITLEWFRLYSTGSDARCGQIPGNYP